jgi:hypothetical protein
VGQIRLRYGEDTCISALGEGISIFRLVSSTHRVELNAIVAKITGILDVTSFSPQRYNQVLDGASFEPLFPTLVTVWLVVAWRLEGVEQIH